MKIDPSVSHKVQELLSTHKYTPKSAAEIKALETNYERLNEYLDVLSHKFIRELIQGYRDRREAINYKLQTDRALDNTDRNYLFGKRDAIDAICLDLDVESVKSQMAAIAAQVEYERG